MKRTSKFLIICAILIGIGITLQATGFALGGSVTGFGIGSDGFHVYSPHLERTDYSSYGYEEYEIALDSFHSFKVYAEYADIKVTLSDHYGVRYQLNTSQDTIDYNVTDGTLEISQRFKRRASANEIKFFYVEQPIFNYFNSQENQTKYIEILVPADASFHTISLESDCGDIQLSDISATDILIENSYGSLVSNNIEAAAINLDFECGDLDLSNITADSFSAKNSYGSLILSDIHVNDKCTLYADCGDIDINDSYFHTLQAEDYYGSITGANVSCSDMNLTLESGECIIKELTANSTDISSEYGEVFLALTTPLSEYGCDLNVDYGSIIIDGMEIESQSHISRPAKSHRQINIDCSSGDIILNGS